MHKLLLFALAVTAVFAYDDDLSYEHESCDGFLSSQCRDEAALVHFATSEPGNCVTKMCSFKPKKGYTEHPERKMQVKFQPSKYTKHIIYSFKSYDAETCAIPNQMCQCDDIETCKCNSKKASFCRQQYEIVKGYFLVYNPNTKPHSHKKPYVPYVPPHNPTPHYPPPHHTPHHGPPPPPPPPPVYNYKTESSEPPIPSYNKQENIYKFNPQSPPESDEKSSISDLLSGGDDHQFYGMRSLQIGGPSDDDSNKNGNDFLKYFLLSQMMNKQQGGPSYGGPSYGGPSYGGPSHHDHQPDYNSPQPNMPGNGFPPSLLYLLMGQNKGSKSGGFLKMLPFLMGNSQFGANLRMETLYVKIPRGCDCEEANSYGDMNPLLQYFLFQNFPFKSQFSPKFPHYGKPSSSDYDNHQYFPFPSAPEFSFPSPPKPSSPKFPLPSPPKFYIMEG